MKAIIYFLRFIACNALMSSLSRFQYKSLPKKPATDFNKISLELRSISEMDREERICYGLELIAARAVTPNEADLFLSTMMNYYSDDIPERYWVKSLESFVAWRLPAVVNRIFNRIIDLSIPIQCSLLTDIISMNCDLGHFEVAMSIFDRAKVAGFDLSLNNFMPLLKSCGSAARARSLLQKMKFLEIDINVISYTTAIKSFEQTGDWRSALELLDLMPTFGIRPNEITYCCAISVASRGRAGDIAINLIREMTINGISPNHLCYGGALTACARSKMWDEVELLLEEMVAHELPVQQSILCGVINTCRASSTSFRKSKSFSEAADDSWSKALWLVEKWAHSVPDLTESLFTMAMDILESHEQFERVLYVFKLLKSCKTVPYSKSSILFALRAAARVIDVDSALELLEDAKLRCVDTSPIYNGTMIICDLGGRHLDAIRILLDMIRRSSGRNSYQIAGQGPPIYITRRIVTNALDSLTNNFTSVFTNIVDGRLAPTTEAKPFIDDLTEVLKYTIYERRIYLPANCYPIANKLLLDASDYVTVRTMLNHTLYLRDVNSSRLYDFAARSLIRVETKGVAVLSLLIEDLCQARNYKLAGGIFLLVISRLSNQVCSEVTSRSRPLIRADRQFVYEERRRKCLELHSFFERGRKLLQVAYTPPKTYKLVAYAYRYANMPDLMLGVYRTALYDGVSDKHLKNLVVYNLAKSVDYWDAALQVLEEMTETPDLFMYRSAISACETGGDWENAIYLLGQIEQHGYNLTTSVVTSAISACAASGRSAEVIQLLDQMEAKQIPCNVWTFNAALSSCAKHGNWRDALKIFEKMRTTIASSKETRNSFSRINSFDSLEPSEAISLQEEAFFRANGLMNDITINVLIQVLAEGGQDLLVDEVYQHAISSNILNPYENVDQGLIDLHSHSVFMAKAAVRYTFESILSLVDGEISCTSDWQSSLHSFIHSLLDTAKGEKALNMKINMASNHGEKDALVFITGKGDKLQAAIRDQLKNEFRPPVNCFISPRNTGRIIVSGRSLRAWIFAHRGEGIA